jgi:hypothetical protein
MNNDDPTSIADVKKEGRKTESESAKSKAQKQKAAARSS